MSRTDALVTPSYWRDHERFLLLARSVDRWVPEHVVHHVVVARREATDGWGSNDQAPSLKLGLPTLAATRPVPPLKGRDSR